jgi:hypothetical protein
LFSILIRNKKAFTHCGFMRKGNKKGRCKSLRTHRFYLDPYAHEQIVRFVECSLSSSLANIPKPKMSFIGFCIPDKG